MAALLARLWARSDCALFRRHAIITRGSDLGGMGSVGVGDTRMSSLMRLGAPQYATCLRDGVMLESHPREPCSLASPRHLQPRVSPNARSVSASSCDFRHRVHPDLALHSRRRTAGAPMMKRSGLRRQRRAARRQRRSGAAHSRRSWCTTSLRLAPRSAYWRSGPSAAGTTSSTRRRPEAEGSRWLSSPLDWVCLRACWTAGVVLVRILVP